MAGHRHNYRRHFPLKHKHGALHDILDFGPEKAAAHEPTDVTERIKRLVRQLQEINRRIDDLSNRY